MIVLGIETSCDETSVAIVKKKIEFYWVMFYQKILYLK